MKYIYLVDNIVHEIIPEENPSFPGIPITDRYTADFLNQCVVVEDDIEVEQNDLYVDGSFVKPITPEPEIPADNMETYIAQLRENKISALSATCESTIHEGAEIQLSDGSTEKFEFKDKDQDNIRQLWDAVKTGATSYPYQSDSGECKIYSNTDIAIIYQTMSHTITSNLTYYHQLKKYISTLETIDEINAVTWGQELTGEYLEKYNEMMQVAEEEMQLVINRITMIE